MNTDLQQLKDIHLPAAIPLWPVAPGWIILFVILLGLISYLFFIGYQRKKRKMIVKFALSKLKHLSTEKPDNMNIAAEISTLIRRTALYYFRREEIAGLSGDDWLKFLNRSGNTTKFTGEMGNLLINGPYRKNNTADLTPLFALTQNWLTTISKMKKRGWRINNMFTFAWPVVFLLFPLFWIMQYLPKMQKQNETMLRVPFLSRIQTLNQKSTSIVILPRFLKQFLCISVWSLLILAAANPQWLGEPLPIKQNGRNIMLAIDLSQSMEIPDLQRNNQVINRLQTVKEVAAHFIEKRQGDKLGLILFGSKAYLQTPLTFDRKTVHTMLDEATIGLAGTYTAIGDAIALAVKKFSTENINSRILILLTDGSNNSGNIDPLEAAALAKDDQIKIYTIGIGASKMTVQGIFGSHIINPSADLDETLLKKIAVMTQGQYFRAQDKKTLASILESINELEPISTDAKTMRPVTSLFYWPLAAALLFYSLLIFPHFNQKLRL